MRRKTPAASNGLVAIGSLIVTVFLNFGPEAHAATLDTKVAELHLADPALDKCIKTYADQEGYQTVAEVKEIPCFNLGIKSVIGLEIFTEALVIDLSRNEIEDFLPLFGLNTRLGYIDIHANPVKCSHMIQLSQALRQAFRVGFDSNNCVPDFGDVRSTPAPAPAPGPAPEPTPQPSPEPKPATTSYSAVAPIIADACGACHQGSKKKGGVSLDSEELLIRHGRAVVSDIEGGSMPPKDHSWGSSPDGQMVLKYLQEQIAAGRIPAGKAPKHDDDDDDDDEDEHDDDDDD